MSENFIDRVIGILLESRLDELSDALKQRALEKASTYAKAHYNAAARMRRNSPNRQNAYAAGARRLQTANKIKDDFESRKKGETGQDKRPDIMPPGSKHHSTVGFGTNRRDQTTLRRGVTRGRLRAGNRPEALARERKALGERK